MTWRVRLSLLEPLRLYRKRPYRPQSTTTEEMRSFHPRPTKGTLPPQVCLRPPKFACSNVVMSHPGAQVKEEILSFQKPGMYPMLLLARIGSCRPPKSACSNATQP